MVRGSALAGLGSLRSVSGGGTVFSLPSLLEQAFSLASGYYRT
jgi:hypothetical protein